MRCPLPLQKVHLVYVYSLFVPEERDQNSQAHGGLRGGVGNDKDCEPLPVQIVQTRDDIDVPKLANSRYLQWIDSRHMVGIQFASDNRVVGKDFGDVKPLPVWRRS